MCSAAGENAAVSTVVRPADPSDAPALAALHLDVWEDAYTGLMPQRILDERRGRPLEEHVARWERNLANQIARTWVAEDAGGLVGFASSGPGRDADLDGVLELMALYVRARVYGAGVGHSLFRAAIGDAPAYLWVLEGNERAIGFYERQGFDFDGHTEDEDEGRHLRMAR